MFPQRHDKNKGVPEQNIETPGPKLTELRAKQATLQQNEKITQPTQKKAVDESPKSKHKHLEQASALKAPEKKASQVQYLPEPRQPVKQAKIGAVDSGQTAPIFASFTG